MSDELNQDPKPETPNAPTSEQIAEAQKDASKKVVEASDGVHILERMQG